MEGDVVVALREIADGIERERILVASLVKATRRLIEVMQMQEKRESGDFHIGADSFRPLWDEALRQARAICDNCGDAGADES